MQTITPDQLKMRLDQGEEIAMIDVREPEEIAQGMISGARHIQLATIPERLSEIAKDKETIIICRSGNRSGRAIEYLESLGYTNLVNLAGGMLEWERL
jgi:rhodanese-related sulfurtransferase